jgi:hypothetical protein
MLYFCYGTRFIIFCILIILFKVTSEEKERKYRKYFFEKVKDAKTFSKKKSIISPGNLPFLVIIFKKVAAKIV